MQLELRVESWVKCEEFTKNWHKFSVDLKSTKKTTTIMTMKCTKYDPKIKLSIRQRNAKNRFHANEMQFSLLSFRRRNKNLFGRFTLNEICKWKIVD